MRRLWRWIRALDERDFRLVVGALLVVSLVLAGRGVHGLAEDRAREVARRADRRAGSPLPYRSRALAVAGQLPEATGDSANLRRWIVVCVTCPERFTPDQLCRSLRSISEEPAAGDPPRYRTVALRFASGRTCRPAASDRRVTVDLAARLDSGTRDELRRRLSDLAWLVMDGTGRVLYSSRSRPTPRSVSTVTRILAAGDGPRPDAGGAERRDGRTQTG